MIARKVVKKILSQEQVEGVGARVRRSIGRPEIQNFDPFLMLDEFSVKKPAGFPDHPHRGFETVTYMLTGSFEHQDFVGHRGVINPGDLQWMTAGRGIVHSEVPVSDGLSHGLQLWVNLARKDKMIEPAYQELKDEDIPRKEEKGVEVKVIAGESMGIQSPVYTRTPTMYLDFRLAPGASFVQPTPPDYNTFAYVLEGDVFFGEEELQVSAHHTVIFSLGDSLRIMAKDKSARLVVIGGRPLNEPVVQHGPFVMNSREEIYQAVMDFQAGKNGFEKAPSWSSSR